MSQIMLTEEQAQILASAKGPVEALSAEGKTIGLLEFTSEEQIIEEVHRRRAANQKRFSTQQVQAHLKSLEEAASNGATNDELRQLLKELQTESTP